MEEEKISPKVQQIPGLKLKKYLLFQIANDYLGGYPETNRLIALSCKLGGKEKKADQYIF